MSAGAKILQEKTIICSCACGRRGAEVVFDFTASHMQSVCFCFYVCVSLCACRGAISIWGCERIGISVSALCRGTVGVWGEKVMMTMNVK